MRAVVQRVSEASVVVDDETVGAIGPGLLVYLGAGRDDVDADGEVMTRKILGLRIFTDESGKMTRSVQDLSGGILVVSQFTLFGDVRKGRRPSFTHAAPPDDAKRLYERVVSSLRASGLPVETGTFRAHMDVRARVDGPVTILIDTHKTF